MKKLLLFAVCACLAVVANAQVDYRDVVTGYYQCTTRDSSYDTGNISNIGIANFIITLIGQESDSTIRFTNLTDNYWTTTQILKDDLTFGRYFRGVFNPLGTGFIAIGELSIDPGLIAPHAEMQFTCAKTGPLSVTENAINTKVIVAQTNGALLINQQGKLYADRVVLYTVDGKEVSTTQLTNTIQTLQTTGLSSGMYLLAFYNNGHFAGSKKVVLN